MNKSTIIASLAILAAVGTAHAADSRVDTKAMVGADSTVRQQTGATYASTGGTSDAAAQRTMAMGATVAGMGWAGSSTATN